MGKAKSSATLRGEAPALVNVSHLPSLNHSSNPSSRIGRGQNAYAKKACALRSPLDEPRPNQPESTSGPSSPISTTDTQERPNGSCTLDGHRSSNDEDLETASEGPASMWGRTASFAGHHRKSSSLGSRLDYLSASSETPVVLNTSLPPTRPLSPALSEAREVLRDLSTDSSALPLPNSPTGSLAAGEASGPNFVWAEIAQSENPHSSPQAASSVYHVMDTSGRLALSSALPSDTAEEQWSANFWAVITDPKNGHAFFYNPKTGDCRWVVPAGTIVLPCNPEGDWMEFFDEGHGLPYYYHTKQRKTQWEKPEGLVIPLTALQHLSASQDPRAGFTESSTAPTDSQSTCEQNKKYENSYSNRRRSVRAHAGKSSRRYSQRTDDSSAGTASPPSRRSHEGQRTPLLSGQLSKARHPATLGRNSLMSDALEEARRAGDATQARSRIVRQRSAFDLTDVQRHRQRKNGQQRPRAATATSKLPSFSSGAFRRATNNVLPKQSIPRDDSGVVILSDEGMPSGSSLTPHSSPARGSVSAWVPDSGSDYRTPFTSTLNSIREQSTSGSSNSLSVVQSRGESGLGRRNEDQSQIKKIKTVGSLLSIPLPPPMTGRDKQHSPNVSGKFGALGPPPTSPARSISMMTLSSYGEHGPIRRPRDPEKRRSKGQSPELRFAPGSPDTRAAQAVTSRKASPLPRKSADSTEHRASHHFDHFAASKLAVRKRGLLQRKVDPKELLRWSSRHSSTASLLPLDSDLTADSLHCFKVILRLCGERDRPVFYPKVPPVAIGFNPGRERYEHGRPRSSGSNSPSAVHQRSNRQRIRCLLDTQTSMEGDGSSVWEEQRWLLETCIAKPQLRDEVFCRLITRLDSHAPPAPRFRAWQFFGVLLTSIAPLDSELGKSLEAFAEDVSTSSEEHESLRTLARHCAGRLSAVQNVGSRTKAPTLPEIRAAWEAAFNPAVFGQKLEVIMDSQAHSYPNTAIPIVLPFLVQTLYALDGLSTRGIFRLSGDVEKLVELRLRIDRGQYSLKGVISEASGGKSSSKQKDALTVASLIRLFLRELQDPLLPTNAYNHALQAAAKDDVQACIELVGSLDTIHRRVFLYSIALLQHFARAETSRATDVGVEELSLIFAPAIFRCPSTEISIISTNARFEAKFIRLLIGHLPCDTVDADYTPNIEQGLQGQHIQV
ncbi:unnamed protein product [Sympodiomycopsis kandeliae]